MNTENTDTPKPQNPVIHVPKNWLPQDHREAAKAALNLPFEPDLFQAQSFHLLHTHQSLFVAAHTSAGKTLVADYAVHLSLAHGTRTIYTSPVKALSNQKFYDFMRKFGQCGIVTGDVQIMPEARCLVMTTEILRNTLYRQNAALADVEFVVFDEVHYVNDPERGVIWEECLIMLPRHVTLIMLSATIANVDEFCAWVGRVRGHPVHVVQTDRRVVPLEHRIIRNGAVYSIEGRLLKTIGRTKDSHLSVYRQPREGRLDIHSLTSHLRDEKLFPAICFCFSKQRCEEYARATGCLSSEQNRAAIAAYFEHVRVDVAQVARVKALCLNGVGVHHSDLLPVLKEVVEFLFARGLLRVLYATETFALGVNMPARSVVFMALSKYVQEDPKGFQVVCDKNKNVSSVKNNKTMIVNNDKINKNTILSSVNNDKNVSNDKNINSSTDYNNIIKNIENMNINSVTTLNSVNNTDNTNDIKINTDDINNNINSSVINNSCNTINDNINTNNINSNENINNTTKSINSINTTNNINSSNTNIINKNTTNNINISNINNSSNSNNNIKISNSIKDNINSSNTNIINKNSRNNSYLEISKHLAEQRKRSKRRYLTTSEYTQMSGRAGRRGLDSKGVVLINGYDLPPPEVVRNMIYGKPQPLCSRFRLGFAMILSLLLRNNKIEDVLRQSFGEDRVQKRTDALMLRLLENRELRDKVAKEHRDAFGCCELCADVGAFIDVYGEGVRQSRIFICKNRKGLLKPGSVVFTLSRAVCRIRKIGEGGRYCATLMGALALGDLLNGRAKGKINTSEEQEVLIDISEILFILDPGSLAIRTDYGTGTGTLYLQRLKRLAVDFRCVRCPHFEENISLMKKLREISALVESQERELGDESLSLINDYLRYLEFLKMYGYYDGIVTKKGRFASEIRTLNEILVTEMVFKNEFADLSGIVILALFTSMITESRSKACSDVREEIAKIKSNINFTITDTQASHFDQIIAGIEKIESYQNSLFFENGFLCDFNFSMVLPVYDWCSGTPFQQIVSRYGVAEGLVVRVIMRLDECCRELEPLVGDIDPHLCDKISKARECLKRDCVFEPGLYFSLSGVGNGKLDVGIGE